MMDAALLFPLGALGGLCLGSFAATAAVRTARDEQALGGRSRCDACAAPLSFAQTVPIAAFVWTRGACGICGARIDRTHLAGELGGAAIVVAAMAAAPPARASLVAVVGLLLLATAIVDLRTRRLPDLLSLAIAVLGFGASLLRSAEAAIAGVAAAVLAFLLLEGVRRAYRRLRGRSGLGFGDVKLIAALALWLGLGTPWAVALAAALGLAGARVVRGADGRLPFGPFIAAGAFAVGIIQEAGVWPM